MRKTYTKILALGAALGLCVISAAQAPSEIRFIVEPYVQQVNEDSFSILWETSEPGKDIVYLAPGELNILSPAFKQTAVVEKFDIFHNVKITGLKSGRSYFYKVVSVSQSGDTVCGPVTPLSIPDYNQMPVSFAVVGDTQHNPLVWGRLSNLIYREHPSFIVHAGDLVRRGPDKDYWTEEFFKPAKDILRFFPIYPAPGNHEQNADWYYRYFDLPSPEWFYTVKKGNVIFIFVDTNKDILPGSAQYKNLEKLLASSGETWKIMVHHHPVYSSSENSYGNTWYQLAVHGDPNVMHLKRLYETYGVDMVLNGHVHNYERTWPINNEKVDPVNGVTYVTLGGGGGVLDKAAANKTWYDAKTRDVHHFLNVNIVGNTMFAQAIDSAGITFDSWIIEKPVNYNRINPPLLTADKQYFIDSTTVFVQKEESQHGDIYFKEKGEFRICKTSETKICIHETTLMSAYVQDGNKSRVAEKKIEKLLISPARKKGEKKVKADYCEGNWITLPDFNRQKIIRSFILDSVTLAKIQPRVDDHFAVRFTGSFIIPETDVYRFLLESFDGSRLYLDGKELINNDGIHYEISKEAFAALEKGIHSFEVLYFDFARRETLNLKIGTQTGEMFNFNKLVMN
ncbi:MAG TPA: metallophosphoesterase [Bacteroidales bacterium]|nr:metallophosphoesterase [Bacteroidales bacterium]